MIGHYSVIHASFSSFCSGLIGIMLLENSTGLKKTDLIHNDMLSEALRPRYHFEVRTNDSFLRSTSAA
jgi:hypothetical protein